MAQQKRSNWIEDQIKRMGEDFIVNMNPEGIQRAAKQRIFRDMVKGNINYEVHGKYFQDPKFLENLIIAAQNELQNNSIVYYALCEYDINHPGNPLVIENKATYHALTVIHETILTRLYWVKNSYYNTGYLTDLASVLFGYRNRI